MKYDNPSNRGIVACKSAKNKAAVHLRCTFGSVLEQLRYLYSTNVFPPLLIYN
jgi:hypothetical protein